MASVEFPLEATLSPTLQDVRPGDVVDLVHESGASMERAVISTALRVPLLGDIRVEDLEKHGWSLERLVREADFTPGLYVDPAAAGPLGTEDLYVATVNTMERLSDREDVTHLATMSPDWASARPLRPEREVAADVIQRLRHVFATDDPTVHTALDTVLAEF